MVTDNSGARRQQPHNQEQFPFMRLPKELRLIIYEMAMEDLVATMTVLEPTKGDYYEDVAYAFLRNADNLRGKQLIMRGYLKSWQPYVPVDLKSASLIGPLALLHSSPVIYAEGLHHMKAIIGAQQTATEGQREAAINACWEELANLTITPLCLYQMSREVGITDYHLWELQKVMMALEGELPCYERQGWFRRLWASMFSSSRSRLSNLAIALNVWSEA